MDAIDFRAATADDVDAIERYHHRCFRQSYAAQLAAGEFDAPDRDGTREQFRSWFDSDSEFDTLVATVDDLPVGHVTVYRHHLVHLFVEPERHGTGLGRRLLTMGEARIVAAGHSELELHTRVENLQAISFYEALGWELTDRVIHTIEHGISYDEHVLVKHRP